MAYRIKKQTSGKVLNMSNFGPPVFVGIVAIAAGFAIGFVAGGPTPPPANVNPQTVIVVPPPPPPPPKERTHEDNSSIYYDGKFHYMDVTTESFVYKIKDKDNHSVCYVAEGRYQNTMSMSCLPDTEVPKTEDKKDEKKEEPKQD